MCIQNAVIHIISPLLCHLSWTLVHLQSHLYNPVSNEVHSGGGSLQVVLEPRTRGKNNSTI